MKKYIACLVLIASIILSASEIKAQKKGVIYYKLVTSGYVSYETKEVTNDNVTYYVAPADGKSHIVHLSDTGIKFDLDAVVTKKRGDDNTYYDFVITPKLTLRLIMYDNNSLVFSQLFEGKWYQFDVKEVSLYTGK